MKYFEFALKGPIKDAEFSLIKRGDGPPLTSDEVGTNIGNRPPCISCTSPERCIRWFDVEKKTPRGKLIKNQKFCMCQKTQAD